MAKKPFRPLLAKTITHTTASPRTLTEQVYAQLRGDIIETRLPPGSRLRIEHLRHSYNVGAGTLREALTRLVSDALVVAEGQRGFCVTPMTLEDLHDVTRLRVHIEVEALRQSIRCGDAAWRAQLRASYEALAEFEQPLTTARRQQWEVLNLHFHNTLLAAWPSPWTHHMLQLLARHGERYRCVAMQLPHLARNVHEEHTRIFEAAHAGHEARAALALEAHIWATPHALMDALQSGAFAWPQWSIP